MYALPHGHYETEGNQKYGCTCAVGQFPKYKPEPSRRFFLVFWFFFILASEPPRPSGLKRHLRGEEAFKEGRGIQGGKFSKNPKFFKKFFSKLNWLKTSALS